tara:strand:- start:31223 stop:31894 length:672 start_codon:yes stop_codon:yes gene_type:complete
MATKLPYLSVYGTLDKMLDRILEAQTPPRFTQDFLTTKLGFKGGNYMALIPLLKKMGFLGSDGSPTSRYRKFRNTDQSGTAVAAGVRQAFSELYARNEYAHELSDSKLKGFVVEITGAKADSTTTRAIVKTFVALKGRADFEALANESGTLPDDVQAVEGPVPATKEQDIALHTPQMPPSASMPGADVGLRLSYTINLNLPETTNVAVFDAIFTSLKANLLNR